MHCGSLACCSASIRASGAVCGDKGASVLERVRVSERGREVDGVALDASRVRCTGCHSALRVAGAQDLFFFLSFSSPPAFPLLSSPAGMSGRAPCVHVRRAPSTAVGKHSRHMADGSTDPGFERDTPQNGADRGGRDRASVCLACVPPALWLATVATPTCASE